MGLVCHLPLGVMHSTVHDLPTWLVCAFMSFVCVCPILVQTARVAGRFIEKRLGTPSLVRETSKSVGQYAPWKAVGRLFGYYKVTCRVAGSLVLPVCVRAWARPGGVVH